MKNELIKWTRTEMGIMSTEYTVTANDKLFKYALAFIDNLLIYDILSKFDGEATKDDNETIYGSLEFFKTLSRNAHHIEYVLSLTKTKLGYDVFVSGKTLTLKTKVPDKAVKPTKTKKPKSSAGSGQSITVTDALRASATRVWCEKDISYDDSGEIDFIHTPMEAIEALYPGLANLAMDAKISEAKKLSDAF
jgi:hypothetical protein